MRYPVNFCPNHAHCERIHIDPLALINFEIYTKATQIANISLHNFAAFSNTCYYAIFFTAL